MSWFCQFRGIVKPVSLLGQRFCKSQVFRSPTLDLGFLILTVHRTPDYYTEISFCLIVKGSPTRDLRLQVFFMNQCPPGPPVLRWGCFEFFSKIRGDICEWILTPAINCSAVSTTPAINPCQGEITQKPKIFFCRCQRHCRLIIRWCRWHRRLKSPAYISLPTPKN